MARRSDHSREELAELALLAATKLLRAHGAEGLTIRLIAAEIGYSPGTLYNLFENQDDLLLKIAARTLDDMLSEANSAITAQEPAAALHQLAAFYFRFTRAHAQEWRLVMEHRLPAGQRHPRWYRTKVVQVLGKVEEALVPLFTDSMAERRRRAAMMLFASMQGICSVTQPGALTAVPERMALELAHDLINAFLSQPRDPAPALAA
jgi:AcrR family transcriptional regulator